MTPIGSAGAEELRRRTLALIRRTAPFAYCNACLSLRLETSLAQTAVALAELMADGDARLMRTRRACYGCARVLEISALRDGPPR